MVRMAIVLSGPPIPHREAQPPAVVILPRALRAFERTDPQVHVDLRMMSALERLRTLRSGELDVAFTNYIVPKDFEGLSLEELGTYPLRVAAHKKHRFARLREVPVSEVARQPILAFLETNILRTKYCSRNYFCPTPWLSRSWRNTRVWKELLQGWRRGVEWRLFIRTCLVSLASAWHCALGSRRS